MKEKQINEQKLRFALKNLSFKEEELNNKINFLMTTESSKEDDLELKLLGLDQVENTFKKKLELELKGYNSELLRLNKKNSFYNENNNKTEKKNTNNLK